jgi:hypothetical protein
MLWLFLFRDPTAAFFTLRIHTVSHLLACKITPKTTCDKYSKFWRISLLPMRGWPITTNHNERNLWHFPLWKIFGVRSSAIWRVCGACSIRFLQGRGWGGGSQFSSGGQNDDFRPLTYTLGGGAWGAGTNMWHPETPASYESLPAPLTSNHTYSHTLDTYIWG